MAFVNLEKAFDRVPRNVIWWAMRKLNVEEWLVRMVQSMYSDARSRVCVGDGYSDAFRVGVGVHQGSVLSPLLFIIVVEALSIELHTSCPWELLYADDLAIVDTSLEVLVDRIPTRKKGMEAKGLRVNMGKTKVHYVMIAGSNLNSLRRSGKHPCSVCLSGTERNSYLLHQLLLLGPQEMWWN
ncbi:uncharacterized protein LOC125656570 [Ostrea edulis]|uniref:uncharacterized protein LOC125656570 n=1 Tax=Ostrea edulis TaxID=37623 RepID=UPI0024AE9D19|nr:uncharacterized protein LOC125656570 [Ostrea edulis]